MTSTQEVHDRLAATGLMDDDVELALLNWHVGTLLTAAQDTANLAIATISARPNVDPLEALSASANLGEIIDHFSRPFFEQCKPSNEASNDTFVFRVRLGEITAFASLVVAVITNNGWPRPDRPAPTDPAAMVLDSEAVWWSVIALFNHFPAPILAVLTEETGLNFEEIK